VPEPFHHHPRVHALHQQQGGGGMPQVVEPQVRQARLLQDRVEDPYQVRRVDGLPEFRGKQEARIFPAGPRQFGGFLPSRQMGVQGRHRDAGQCDGRLALRRLGRPQ